MKIAFGFRVVFLLFHILLLCSKSVEQECSDLGGSYIDFQCHAFRFDRQSWTSADDSCTKSLSIKNFAGAHLTCIGSADKQIKIEKFMDRYGIKGAWIGATNRPLLWQWLSNEHVLQSQGCYKDDSNNPSFSYRVQNAGISSERCIDACREAGYGYAGIQTGSNCACTNTINSNTMATGCTDSCTVVTPLSSWCGGPGHLTTVYKIGGANGQWGYNQPDMTPAQKSCAVLDTDLETKMADEDCALRYNYLCQINTTKCSGYGYQRHSFLCYYVSDYKVQDEGVNWETAAKKCQELGGLLATVDNYLLQLAIRNWLTSFFSNQSRKIWIGAFKGGWYWLSGYSFSYTNWAPGEPKKGDGDQCIFVDETRGYKWLALPCNTSKAFICQRGYDAFTTPTLIWIDPTPPSDRNSTSTGSTIGTGATESPISTGSGGSGIPDGSGSTLAADISVNISSTQKDNSIPFSTTSTKYSTENSTEVQDLTGAESTKDTQKWSTLAIGLFALLAVILFLLLILGLVFLSLCIAKNQAGNKVDSIHHYDARPIAHIPNSGNEVSSTTSLKNAAEPSRTR